MFNCFKDEPTLYRIFGIFRMVNCVMFFFAKVLILCFSSKKHTGSCWFFYHHDMLWYTHIDTKKSADLELIIYKSRPSQCPYRQINNRKPTLI